MALDEREQYARILRKGRSAVTPERQKIIREQWQRCREQAREYLRYCGHGEVYRAHVPAKALAEIGDMPEAVTLEVLEFKKNIGLQDGRRIIRVTCDGVEVEAWF